MLGLSILKIKFHTCQSMRKESSMPVKTVINKTLLTASAITALFSQHTAGESGTINVTGNMTASICGDRPDGRLHE
ncbi:hypothetical protein CITSP_01236 [Citrobacter sp. T1.2D-1]|nr:hypothetical protein CITSP_01236 [Citrobacter sp. T1.2D-1]